MEETILYKNHRIEISHDHCPQNPRTEWDNLGTITYKSSRYIIGDVETDDFPDHINEKFNILKTEDYDLSDKERDRVDLWVEKNLIILPVYAYIHSGITISTTGFECKWDSGQTGNIYVSKEKVRKEYGWKILTKKRIEQIEQYLRNEIKTYDDYLTGNVFGYRVVDSGGEEINSCWGFYGDHEESGLIEHAKSQIDYDINYRKEHNEKQEEIAKENFNYNLDMIFA